MLWRRRRLREEGVDAPSLLFHSIFSRAAKKNGRGWKEEIRTFLTKSKAACWTFTLRNIGLGTQRTKSMLTLSLWWVNPLPTCSPVLLPLSLFLSFLSASSPAVNQGDSGNRKTFSPEPLLAWRDAGMVVVTHAMPPKKRGGRKRLMLSDAD